MPHELRQLFAPDAARGSPRWKLAVIERAYGWPDGPLDLVRKRLQSGHSLLLYVHGASMRAVADAVRARVGIDSVAEFGLPDLKAPTPAALWGKSAGLLDGLLAFLGNKQSSPPYAIFHNLDQLADAHAGVDTSAEAKTAMLYLSETARAGAVLGLANLAAGALPDKLRHHFDDELWLEAVDAEHFATLVPIELGKRLSTDGLTLPEMAAALLASRLRWTEPCRAVRIMEEIAPGPSELTKVLDRVAAHARSTLFEPAAPASRGAAGKPAGYEGDTIEILERMVIAPYRNWLALHGGDATQTLRRLPAGIILHGPPGTGKTRLARWLAGRIGLPCRQIGAADLKRPDWGLTERLVRELFAGARRAAPCMVVLDDADDLLPDRERAEGGIASAERGIVNAFLQEIEGFGGRLDGVLLVLTTNRPGSLDRAARSRLSLDLKVPYPLEREQVRQVVLGIAAEMGAGGPGHPAWNEALLAELETFFFGALNDAAVANTNITDPQQRRKLTEGLYAPREIAAALRMLCADGAPNDENKRLMFDYYTRRRVAPQ